MIDQMRRNQIQFAVPLFALIGITAGCATQKPHAAMAPNPFSPDQLDALRASYKTAFPNARIGKVIAVTPGQPYALVGQIDTTGVRVGSILTIIDAGETVITNGRVELINATGLTVRFDDGKRRPVVGDAAILF